MDEARWAFLKSALDAQLHEIAQIFTKIEERQVHIDDPVHRESLGYQLHNLYSAFEDLFKIVADFFENRITERAGYHRELLWRMKIPIAGVRPALLSEESYKLLDSLRAFRHFFRHAYGTELDPKKIALVVQDALKFKDIYSQEIECFLEQVRS
jgi:uncharacterized protein YutE (UPF0331/DUF86 family)